MAQEHLAVANACMLRRVTSREAWSRSFVPPDDNLSAFSSASSNTVSESGFATNGSQRETTVSVTVQS
jgi:hypothetical protein